MLISPLSAQPLQKAADADDRIARGGVFAEVVTVTRQSTAAVTDDSAAHFLNPRLQESHFVVHFSTSKSLNSGSPFAGRGRRPGR